jgi:hypothetical protein
MMIGYYFYFKVSGGALEYYWADNNGNLKKAMD